MANVLSTAFHITKLALDECEDFCQHILSATAKCYAILKEDDSFGPLGRYAVCEECYNKAQEERLEQTTCCNDCKQWKKNSEMRTWKWYDFYAPQGDEPYDICDSCWTEPKHQDRMKADREAMNEEFPTYDGDEENPDW